MRKFLIAVILILAVASLNAQAFDGKGDMKFQIGANFQDNGSGIVVTYDYGLGENFSLGLSSSYVLGVEELIDADFGDRIDFKARFNANLGSVFQLGDKVDIYPGLDLGLKNFGGHLGVRYFFSDGFGIFTELGAPIAKYKTDTLSPAEELHNQFVFSLGASFNLN
ncbi:porin family protein [Arenibacter sp. F20364]|uniref:porin family protein n=1 Tax=Arenibacter sp. F20364 TaxID=2926415 RepID=UPI001FF42E94|nr:porin family protein [Arenibacter sp. F20364]MCK0188760.1 porin family protein [Arenibacter sp. F20364]